jgi:hypothetical protein
MRQRLGRSVDPYFEKLDALCAKITSFGNLPTGWDGEEAVPPPQAVLGTACKLVREMPREAELPSVAPAPDGEIGLTWVNGPKQLNAMLHTDYHLVWVKRLEENGRFLPGAEIDLSVENYPRQFVEEVTALYK